jgi:hypothetical protein
MKEDTLRKILSFFMLCLYVLGVIGGIGYTIYCGAYPIAGGVAALGYMAFGKAKEYFDYLRS